MVEHPLRILIVAEHASSKFGGEAILPLHYFRGLRADGIEAWLLVHERTRDELLATIAEEDHERLRFVADHWLQRLLWAVGGRLPHRIRMTLIEFPTLFLTQLRQRRQARDLIVEVRATLVHQPIPVSPKVPSMMCGLGVPVVIGPMNGGMSFPPGFRGMASAMERLLTTVGRSVSGLLNRLMPGKRRAALLLVANQRTASALPRGPAPVKEIVENGVDLGIWRSGEAAHRDVAAPMRLLFMGRLEALEAVDLLLEAMARLGREQASTVVRLDLLGDGRERQQLENQVRELGLESFVTFHGFLPQSECAHFLRECDALILPSLHECGGAVVLEAMAVGKPVIATDWGGPADYLDDSCGLLVKPLGREAMITGLMAAMARIAGSAELRHRLGEAGRRKVEAHYDWKKKVRDMLAIYREVLAGGEAVDRR